MTNVRLWFALGAGAYAAFLLASFPATAAYRWFAPPELGLLGIEGTLWSGRAALGSAGGLELRDVAWRVSAWRLLTLRAAGRAEARLADGFVATAFSAGPGAVELLDLQANTSLPVLQPLLPVQGTSGLLSASFARLRLERGWPVDVEGALRIQELNVTPFVPTGDGSLIPLGDYDVTFAGGGEGRVAADIRDAGGPLEVAATLTVEPSRAYVLEGTVRARPSAVPALVQGLELMTGEPDAAGRRALGLTGSL